MHVSTRWLVLVVCSATLATGCSESTSTSSSSTAPAAKNAEKKPEGQGTASSEKPEKYKIALDIPRIPIMTEAAGIEIPRVNATGKSLDLKTKIPVDEFNPAAKGKPTEPVAGGRLVMRMHSEPKSMNPVTESSAVQSIMSEGLILQTFAYQHPETYEFTPMLATKWTIEDSIKLVPDYPGYERYVSLPGQTPTNTTSFDYPEAKEPPTIKLTTYGADKLPLGNVWVCAYLTNSKGVMSKDGSHFWSNEQGEVSIAGLKPGTYQVKVGHEIIGESETEGDVVRVKPVSPENPLSKMLLESTESLELQADQVLDKQLGTVFTYHIDPRAKWSDGTPFTAKDIQFSYQVINNAIVDGDSIRGYYSDIVRCDALDPHLIRLQYRQQYFLAFEFTAGMPNYTPPWHYFENKFKAEGKTLTLDRLTPEEEQSQKKVSVSGAAFGKAYNEDAGYGRKILGTGPYMIDSWTENDRLVLKRNPNYWSDEHRGYLDEIVFKFITEEGTAIEALRTGAIDFLYHITADSYHEALKGPPDWMKGKYVKSSWYIPSFSYIGWNLNRPLFQDRLVRIALRMLIDLETFQEKKHKGDSVLVSGSAYYFAPAYDQKVKPIGFDLETARDLLSEAGWADTDGDGILDKDGKKFEFKFLFSTGSDTAVQLSSLMQENCKKVGIQMTIDRLEWASFLEKVMNKDFDAVTLAWLSPLESDPYQIWHSSGAGTESRSSNHVSFKNAEADELIEKLRLTLDKEQRNEIYHEFHHLLDREQPYAFLYTPKDFGAYNQKFRGVKWYRIRPGFDLTEWYIPKELQ